MLRKAKRFAPLLIGLSLFVIGLAGVVLYYTTPKEPEIGGVQVVELAQCSQGYAEGYCPVATYDWSGKLVSPSPDAAPNVIQVWGLEGTDVDTCGLPATYASNIPLVTSGVQGGPQNSPEYEPLANSIRGVLVYGSTVLFYTSSTYTLADGCSGNILVNPTTTPVQGTITYQEDGGTTMTLGTGATYDFQSLNPFMALVVAGGFLGVFGLLVTLDRPLDL